jgi:hypothetical protein
MRDHLEHVVAGRAQQLFERDLERMCSGSAQTGTDDA